MKFKIKILLLNILILSFFCPQFCFAEESNNYDVSNSIFIFDDGNIFSESELSTFNTKAQNIKEIYDVEIVVVFTQDISEDIQSFTDNFLKQKEFSDGLIFVVDTHQRAYFFTVFRSNIKKFSFTFSDEVLDYMCEKIVPFLSENDWVNSVDRFLLISEDILFAKDLQFGEFDSLIPEIALANVP